MRSALLAAASVAGLLLGPWTPPAAAGTAVRLDVPGLVEEAELVFEGRVLAARALQGGGGIIQTEYVVEVAHTWLGDDLPARTFRLPGGVLPSGRGLVLPGMPRVEVGEHVLLFLSPESQHGFRMTVGLAQGKLRVVEDAEGRRALVRDGADLNLLDPATGRVSPAAEAARRDYERVVEEVRAAVADRRERELRGETPAEGRSER